MTIKQGDAYSVPFLINLNGEAVIIENVEIVEFFIGKTRKLYPDDVEYIDGYFNVPLTQTETFAMPADTVVEVDIRVKFIGGDVEGIERKEYIQVVGASSEVEL